jgi:hypothetical protein
MEIYLINVNYIKKNNIILKYNKIYFKLQIKEKNP